MAMYNDIFMRDSLSDTGMVPSPSRCVSHSPDIIPVGKTPLAKPLKLIYEDWNKDVGQDLIQGNYNYIYIRAENLAPNVAGGSVNLYYSPSSILMRPDLWKNNKIGETTVSANEHGQHILGDNPILWNAPKQPTGWHYCFVAQVVTRTHPNPIPNSLSSSGSFANWVRNEPGIAWRNVHIVKQSEEPTKTYLYKFSNLDSFSEEYGFRITCTNMPKGTIIAMSCGSVGPDPQINYGQTLTGGTVEYVYTQSLLPPNFEANLVVSITLPKDQPWPTGGKVDPSYLKIVGGDDLTDEQVENHALLAKHAVHPMYLGLTKEQTPAQQMVLLGDAEIIFE